MGGLKHMKRIAYLLVNKDDEIFMENSTFNSLKNAERQIEYGVKTGFYSEEDWKPKKIILDGQPYSRNIDDLRLSINVVTGFLIFIGVLQWIESGQMDIVVITFYALIIMLMITLFYMFDFIVCMILFIENFCAWLRYKKQDVSDLEIFSLEERVLLFKEDIVCVEEVENKK